MCKLTGYRDISFFCYSNYMLLGTVRGILTSNIMQFKKEKAVETGQCCAGFWKPMVLFFNNLKKSLPDSAIQCLSHHLLGSCLLGKYSNQLLFMLNLVTGFGVTQHSLSTEDWSSLSGKLRSSSREWSRVNSYFNSKHILVGDWCLDRDNTEQIPKLENKHRKDTANTVYASSQTQPSNSQILPEWNIWSLNSVGYPRAGLIF